MRPTLEAIAEEKIHPPIKTEQELNQEEVYKHTTGICFGEQNGVEDCREIDAVLIFGTSKQGCQTACGRYLRDLIEFGNPTDVYVTGGKIDASGYSESDKMRDIIFANGSLNSSGINFHFESLSKNTLENVNQAFAQGLARHEKIAFIGKWQHCGRCRLTIQKVAPLIRTIFQRGYMVSFLDAPGVLAPEFWFNVPEYKRVVFEELAKIACYGERGDIAYPSHIASKISTIKQLFSNLGWLWPVIT